MTVMIIPTETVLETTLLIDSSNFSFKNLDSKDVDSSRHTVSTCSDSSLYEFNCSSRDYDDESKGPIVTPSSRSILKREDSSGSKGKRVCFDSVEIRSYAQTMGDNPSVSYGPPISLDWDYEENDAVAIDEYEAKRLFSRRTLRQLNVSYYHRMAILQRDYGFTEQELVKAQKDADKTKMKRAITNTLLPMMKVEAVFESAGRKAKRMIIRK